jgi:FAD/FMN-containing dehydrogenase/SAM-dependent methyltransferase
MPVFSVATPHSTQDVVDALTGTVFPVSVGGGHFSMGGQTASPGTLHLDLREMNRILRFDPEASTIRVQAGTRWCDIQRFIDPHDLAVKIMQTYANFTVGGTLSVNAHGRYTAGPVASSVRAITLVLTNGEVVEATPAIHAELFNAAIGGYGAVGVITEAELGLVPNARVERSAIKLDVADYPAWFDANVRGHRDVVFHNFDLYPPHYAAGRAVSWTVTDKPATAPRLQTPRRARLLEKYLLWSITETPLGKFRREYLYDPLLTLRGKVHWRNYEAGYDVAELEPTDRQHRTYVLQEYFVPAAQMTRFTKALAATLRRYKVNAVNVSVRHADADTQTVMSWARGETFAFVLYYKQRTRPNALEKVAVWTRELIDAALDAGGTYYLPYQVHATPEQFHCAYPRARELFALKARLDPHYRLRGALWDRYYAPAQSTEVDTGGTTTADRSLFAAVYGNVDSADRFYTFLQNIFNLVPEDRFHTLIKQCLAAGGDDEAIYRSLQAALPGITPRLAMLSHALPALATQKREIGRQTAQLIGNARLRDYVEIGTTGRYVRALRKHASITGSVTLVTDTAPGFSPVDIVERGQLTPIGKAVRMDDYAPLTLPPASADLVSCFIGLHHMAPEKLQPFLASIAAVLRPGGMFVVREHDVAASAMHHFVALAHTVFNAGLGESWATNAAELHHFASADAWVRRIERCGLRSTGVQLRQEGDPTDNLLMAFVKEGATS